MSNTETPKIGLITAISLIVASMIGTGVFTSLGFQVIGIHSTAALLMLWIAGGIVALFGALSYAELAVYMPRSGGEYRYLSNLYHPALGFLSGWVSATLGFAGPVAIACMAFGEYFSNLVSWNTNLLASIILAGITIVNLTSLKLGGRFQTVFTLVNISLILAIIICGFVLPDHSHFLFSLTKDDASQMISPEFFESLVYVSFAYSGWNSATYIAEEIKDPKKNLPKALFWGSFIVMILYLLLNLIFLYSSPISELNNQFQVAFIAAKNIFGQKGALIIAVIISIGLIASINSMMFTGPRVTRAIGQDFPIFKKLAHINSKGSPVYAILLQFLIALILIHISNPKEIMKYIGFTLSLFTTLAVAGVFINRYKNPSVEKKSILLKITYILIPSIFILLELMMMFYLFQKDPWPPIAGFLTILSGLLVYAFIYKKQQ